MADPVTRLHCLVPGCRRTRGQRKGEPPLRDDEEWVCGPHWTAVPRFLRQRQSRLRRRYRHAFGDTPYWGFPGGSPKRLASLRLDRLIASAWKLCKRAVIERGVGLR